ncbi:MAG: ArsR/SmtB family transcription factor [Ilumatobacteraceae bacterium]
MVIDITSLSSKISPAVKSAVPCCPAVTQAALSRHNSTRLASAFAALGDPVRLRLFSLIAATGDNETCACALVKPIGRSQPTVSHHLKVLREAGLITSTKRGTWVWYRVDPERLIELQSVLG